MFCNIKTKMSYFPLLFMLRVKSRSLVFMSGLVSSCWRTDVKKWWWTLTTHREACSLSHSSFNSAACPQCNFPTVGLIKVSKKKKKKHNTLACFSKTVQLTFIIFLLLYILHKLSLAASLLFEDLTYVVLIRLAWTSVKYTVLRTSFSVKDLSKNISLLLM